MAHDDGRDETRPGRPEPAHSDPSAVRLSRADRERAAREQLDLEQLHHRMMLIWSGAMHDELDHFQAVTALEQAERAGDANAVATLDRMVCERRDKERRARHKLHILRRRLRRLRAGGGSGRPWDSRRAEGGE